MDLFIVQDLDVKFGYKYSLAIYRSHRLKPRAETDASSRALGIKFNTTLIFSIHPPYYSQNSSLRTSCHTVVGICNIKLQLRGRVYFPLCL